ncbi:hypothetical protein [Sphingosinicella sp. BN140058]|uniref:hypothetical protein n=1 Tax=Sphingosinicella sp. BN140058 TaxID=1892855 RepID=UPI001011282A|nr:hypothetical protein [Sphingosinicella sp. BN140058]QAY75821.1 hypothetical protein ETR14_04200 [Sphingosinicella sp. BN140058]
MHWYDSKEIAAHAVKEHGPSIRASRFPAAAASNVSSRDVRTGAERAQWRMGRPAASIRSARTIVTGAKGDVFSRRKQWRREQPER